MPRDQDRLCMRCLQASANTQLAPGVGTLQVLPQTAHAVLSPLAASRHWIKHKALVWRLLQ